MTAQLPSLPDETVTEESDTPSPATLLYPSEPINPRFMRGTLLVAIGLIAFSLVLVYWFIQPRTDVTEAHIVKAEMVSIPQLERQPVREYYVSFTYDVRYAERQPLHFEQRARVSSQIYESVRGRTLARVRYHVDDPRIAEIDIDNPFPLFASLLVGLGSLAMIIVGGFWLWENRPHWAELLPLST